VLGSEGDWIYCTSSSSANLLLAWVAPCSVCNLPRHP